jgi:hypothetical protein
MSVPKQVCPICALAQLSKVNLKPVCLGSNVIVAGTAIFGSDKPEEVIATLKSVVDTAQAKIHE